VAGNIVVAWVLTLPLAGALSFLAMLLLDLAFG
jgi:phosphate/sulfate permease